MAVKKSEIYSSLWEACDKLRGGVEPAQYKNYILVLLFFKYVSDKYKGKGKNAEIDIEPEYSFDALTALPKENIGEETNRIIKKFLTANDLNDALPQVSFNDGYELGTTSEIQEKVYGLIKIFNNPEFDFSKNIAAGDDIIGDAYEFLMMKFAQVSGKSKGQFYTPGEVSRVIARIIGIDKITQKKGGFTIYDPTCGSGSLLIHTADEAPPNVLISLYGQEINKSTVGLAYMNMFLHKQGTAELEHGNTLTDPKFLENGELKQFDFVVMNPPFSDKTWSEGLGSTFNRFEDYGMPPAKNGDYAYFLHVLKSLNATGKAGIILPHGVLFRGNAEESIRKKILAQKIIKGIISLPANLFYGTGIPACIIIIDKENADNRAGVFMIDASRNFQKDGNRNKLREQDIEKIVQTFNAQIEISGYSRFVTYQEIIQDNDGNLNVPRYIQHPNDNFTQNIAAHLFGGIPRQDISALQKLWNISPHLQQKIFSPDSSQDIFKLAVPSEKIADIIHADKFLNAEKSFEFDELFNDWCNAARPALLNIDNNTNPKILIKNISAALLQIFKPARVLDNFGVFNRLMDYWVEKMQDDIFAIIDSGYNAAQEIEYKYGKKNNVIGWDGAIIPKDIIEREFFSAELAALNSLLEQSVRLDSELAELIEDFNGDDSPFADFFNDNGEIIQAALTKAAKFPDADDSVKLYADKSRSKTSIDKKIKADRAALDKNILAKYLALSIDEIKHLLFDCIWSAALYSVLRDDFEQILNALSSRLVDLAKQYEFSFLQLNNSSNVSNAEFNRAIERMGF